MLVLILAFRIILIIHVIIILNNFYYKWIINKFCNKNFSRQDNISIIMNVYAIACSKFLTHGMDTFV